MTAEDFSGQEEEKKKERDEKEVISVPPGSLLEQD